MKVLEYLRKTQPVCLKTLSGAFSEDRVAHAYLLAGEPGLPLKELAYFIAQSILCDDPSPLACESCKTCRRVAKDNYADFLFLNGAKSSIKKDDVQGVLGGFSKTPIEKKAKMVYVIHLVENMTTEAVNSLLKFLEEPPSGCYAILTTENVSRVLPTIVSRSETLRILPAAYVDVVEAAKEEGVSDEDAYLLALFLNDGVLIKEESEGETYMDEKKAFLEAMEDFAREEEEGLYRFEKVVIPSFTTKEDARRLVILLSALFKDALLVSHGLKPRLAPYAKIVEGVASRRSHLETSLELTLEARNELDLGLGVELVLDNLARQLLKD